MLQYFLQDPHYGKDKNFYHNTESIFINQAKVYRIYFQNNILWDSGDYPGYALLNSENFRILTGRIYGGNYLSISYSDDIDFSINNLTTPDDRYLKNVCLRNDSSNVYLYTDAAKILFEPDSSNLFSNLYNLTTIDNFNKFSFSQITNMSGMFANCNKLEIIPKVGNSTIDSSYAYYNCRNLRGPFVVPESATNISYMYYNCYSNTTTIAPLISDNVKDMSYAFSMSSLLTGAPSCGKNVGNMRYAYGATGVSGSPACGPNVIDMGEAYAGCSSLNGAPNVGNKVTNAYAAYVSCTQLQGEPVVPNSIVNASTMYQDCSRIYGNAVCGDNVINMSHMYHGCSNLKSATFGKNAEDASYAYYHCNNITIVNKIPNFLNNMYCCFEYCDNLKDIPSFEETNVDNASYCYAYCNNLKNAYIGGGKNLNSSTMYYCYYGCNNIENIFISNNYLGRNEYDGTVSLSLNNFFGWSGNNVLYISPLPNTITNIANFLYGTYIGNSYSDNSLNAKLYPISSNYIINMAYAYSYKHKLFGKGLSGPNVVNMCMTYYGCNNLTEMEPFGPKVNYIRECYCDCNNLTDIYFGSDGLSAGRQEGFYYSSNSDKIYGCFRGCRNIKNVFLRNDIVNLCGFTEGLFSYSPFDIHIEKFYMSDNVFDLSSAFSRLGINKPLEELGIKFNNVINMYNTFFYCYNLKGSPICGDKVINFASAYHYCSNLTGNPVCGLAVEDMGSAYYGCSNLTGNPVCGNNVIDMSSAYSGCNNITGSPVCGPNVIDMSSAYSGCSLLQGSPVFGDNVIGVSGAYQGCKNLEGEILIRPSWTTISYIYDSCFKLTGENINCSNVNYMVNAFAGSQIKSCIIGENIKEANYAFYNCQNLTDLYFLGGNNFNFYNMIARNSFYNVINLHIAKDTALDINIKSYISLMVGNADINPQWISHSNGYYSPIFNVNIQYYDSLSLTKNLTYNNSILVNNTLNNYKLQTTFTNQLLQDTIDSGTMSSVDINTQDFSSIITLEVK